jgi:hypothetical protein
MAVCVLSHSRTRPASASQFCGQPSLPLATVEERDLEVALEAAISTTSPVRTDSIWTYVTANVPVSEDATRVIPFRVYPGRPRGCVGKAAGPRLQPSSSDHSLLTRRLFANA